MFDGRDTALRAVLIPPEQLVSWARAITPQIEKMAAGSGARYTAPDIFAELAAGNMHVWVVPEGNDILCVTVGQIVTYPRIRAMRVIGLVGKNPFRWRRLMAEVERDAKELFGCSMMECGHVPRHFVLLKGYQTTHWLSEKAL